MDHYQNRNNQGNSLPLFIAFLGVFFSIGILWMSPLKEIGTGTFIFYSFFLILVISLSLFAMNIIIKKGEKKYLDQYQSVHSEVIDLAEHIRKQNKRKAKSSHRSDDHAILLSDAVKVIKTHHQFLSEQNKTESVELKKRLSDVYQRTGEVIYSAQEVTELNQRNYQSTFSQSTALDEISADMNAFASHIQAIADNTTQANQFADEMSRVTSMGSSRMDEMMKAFHEISESSEKISEIIKTIDEIASKTNLLSLNATIEANRAGIHGRTFAVVAQEVRDLAIQSRDAVKQITELVNSTVSDLQSGTDISQNAQSALKGIEIEVEKVTAIIKDIVGSANVQAQSVSKFNQNLEEIADLTRLQENNSKQTASVSEELMRFAESIKAELEDVDHAHGKKGDVLFKQSELLFDKSKVGRPLRYPFDPFAPLTYSENGVGKGFFIDLCREIFEKRLHLPIEFAEFDWDTCQSKVFEGESDFVITIATPERLVHTDSQIRTAYPFSLVVYTYADHPRMNEIQQIKTVEDIKKGGFSVVTYPGFGWMENEVESIGIPVTYRKDEFRHLSEKAADLTIEEPLVAAQSMKRSHVDRSKIIRTKVVLNTTPFQFLVSKQSPYHEILPLIDQKFREIRQDGTFERLLTPYT